MIEMVMKKNLIIYLLLYYYLFIIILLFIFDSFFSLPCSHGFLTFFLLYSQCYCRIFLYDDDGPTFHPVYVYGYAASFSLNHIVFHEYTQLKVLSYLFYKYVLHKLENMFHLWVLKNILNHTSSSLLFFHDFWGTYFSSPTTY